MVHYRLTYLPFRGLAEISRQIFVVAGKDFEDVRYTFEEFAKHKDEMPFGQVPVLEVDGKQLAQSHTIARYLAKEFGYAGKNAWDEALVNSIADQQKDLLFEIRPYFRVLLGFEKGDLNALGKDLFVPSHHKFFTFITKFLKNNKSGYLVGDSLTWVDLLVAEIATWAKKFPTLYDSFPEVKAHAEKIRSIPALKKWIETRPDTIL
ncbi:glutathione S-transferase protein [Teladorsagia circumcincta]|uniref:glutathione transferase n=1 Tax=Teladorsagia circumcincta TaxID=45464 RepID=A0A2G9UMN3_TELCI|nr:glutathione S-transferase protein [Teladorsagia circumcincta]